MDSVALYGEERPEPVVAHLKAGPISCKFQDGELRYLEAGGMEIIRRVYFGVRDHLWDTAMPLFDRLEIQDNGSSFKVSMSARCRNDRADYSWTGEIVGSEDGVITFIVDGVTNTAFKTPRIGLNVLYGAESLCGQAFTLTHHDGSQTQGAFPKDIQHSLLSPSFQALTYTTPTGMRVSTQMENCKCGMEDQRNFCDSSFKAFTSLDYNYPDLNAGVRARQKVRVEVKDAPRYEVVVKPDVYRVTVGEPTEGSHVPTVLDIEPVADTPVFNNLSSTPRGSFKGDLLRWFFNPSLHQPDDDTFTENTSSIVDQVATARKIASNAKLRLEPITFDSPYPRPGPDPRNEGQFAAMWAWLVLKYASEAGVDEAVFRMQGQIPTLIRVFMKPLEGWSAHKVTVTPGLRPAVQALALSSGGSRTLVVINTSAEEVRVEVDAEWAYKSRTVSLEPMTVGQLDIIGSKE